MNKHQFQLRELIQALKRQTRQHAETIAATLCGVLMGILFASHVSVYQAQKFQAQTTQRQEIAYRIPALPETTAAPSSTVSAYVVPAMPLTNVVSSVSSVTPIKAVTPKKRVASSSSSPALKAVFHPAAQLVPAVRIAETAKSSSSSSENVASSESASSSSVQSSVSSSQSASSESYVSSSASSEIASSEAPTFSSASSSSSIQSSVTSEPEGNFPPFLHASYPVGSVPNWGAMRTPAEWNRTYAEMTPADFVPIPRYDMAVLTTPMAGLLKPLRDENIPLITAKLFYSTRFFGRYDLDSPEFVGTHPALDLKLARGTPVGAIAGGRVAYVESTQMLGLHVVIEHRLRNGETYYSIYGHFDRAAVHAGETVVPGQIVGYVGMTGNTSAPHVHLQIDRGQPGEAHHEPYLPSSPPSPGEGLAHVVHPVTFIAKYRAGEQ